jgi:hypothetical protein
MKRLGDKVWAVLAVAAVLTGLIIVGLTQQSGGTPTVSVNGNVRFCRDVIINQHYAKAGSELATTGKVLKTQMALDNYIIKFSALNKQLLSGFLEHRFEKTCAGIQF